MDISNIQKKMAAYMHRDHSKLYITPYREWGAILVTSAVLGIGMAAFSYYVFQRYYVQGVEAETSGEVVQTMSEIEMLKRDTEDILGHFEKKEQTYSDLLKEKRSFESVLFSTTTVATTSSATTVENGGGIVP